jgi:hypothetical protein
MTGSAFLPETQLTGPAFLPDTQEPDHVDQVPVRQCGRCGGVGTHYLTCPALKLPPGYRISDSRTERRAP